MNGNKKSPEEYQIEDFVTDESFINYLFSLNQEDITFWQQWQTEHPDDHLILEAAQAMLCNISLTLPEREFNEELSKIRSAIGMDAGSSRRREPPAPARLLHWIKPSRRSPDRRNRIARFALPVLLILITGGIFVFRQLTLPSNHSVARRNDGNEPVVFALSDGTVVTLAPHSVFRFRDDFGVTERLGNLEGEAQFQVARDDAHAFKVREGDIVATVLGTVFNIKKQPADSAILVELLKGKLKVESIQANGSIEQSVILYPDERVVYKPRSKQFHKEKWQSQYDLTTKIAHLSFRQSNFDEVATQFKSAFGLTIINQGKKKTWRFTGEFNNASVTTILESICTVEKLNYEVEGDTVFIK
ncbi:MAG: FecR family protein [Bacteroidota bacterium]|nr:FecR family protein [Bacteroidota bacterium]